MVARGRVGAGVEPLNSHGEPDLRPFAAANPEADCRLYSATSWWERRPDFGSCGVCVWRGTAARTGGALLAVPLGELKQYGWGGCGGGAFCLYKHTHIHIQRERVS